MDYLFRPRSIPTITKWTADKIIKLRSSGLKEARLTLDLGLTTEKIKLLKDETLIRGYRIKYGQLRKIVEKNDAVYMVDEGGVRKISFFSDGSYYKLKAVDESTAPTLEINGIHMHRIKDITPWEDSQMKISALKVSRGDDVLDICTGLGYTAIISLKRGASKVVTIEKDLNVLRVAELNPWSRKLADERVSLLLGDAFKVLERFEDGSFDKIVHDPPRFSLAGELYSLEFYREMYRVLKKGGMVFHYVGFPGGKYRRKDVLKGVSNRMSKTGFLIEKRWRTGGVIGRKIS